MMLNNFKEIELKDLSMVVIHLSEINWTCFIMTKKMTQLLGKMLFKLLKMHIQNHNRVNEKVLQSIYFNIKGV